MKSLTSHNFDYKLREKNTDDRSPISRNAKRIDYKKKENSLIIVDHTTFNSDSIIA